MTPAAIARKASELESLLTNHRIVKVDMQQEHMTCIARVDMPEYGIKAGEQFDLVAAASHPGYAYIIRETAEGRECSCMAHGACKHLRIVNAIVVARYYARKASEHTIVTEPVWRDDDTAAHVEDDLRTRMLRAPMTSNAGFSLLAPERPRRGSAA